MKPARQFPQTAQGRAAFTLAEIMVATAIFSMVIIGLVYSHVLGLKMFNITATKLNASQQARAALNQVRDEIRSAKAAYVGNATSNGFASITGNGLREGNAVQIVPSSNTNSPICYYRDPAYNDLKRIDGTNPIEVVSLCITNPIVFYAEDYAGNTLTNNQNNRVIRMSLEFYQWEFLAGNANARPYYDYYHLQTRITRRAIQ